MVTKFCCGSKRIKRFFSCGGTDRQQDAKEARNHDLIWEMDHRASAPRFGLGKIVDKISSSGYYLYRGERHLHEKSDARQTDE
jgi:hypothetical protein